MESKYPHNNFRSKNNILISKYCPDISSINSKLETDNGNTPLILALLCQDLQSFSELLSFGASPNIPNNSSETPLHISVTKGYLDFLTLLIKYNADCNLQNKEGNTPLHLAVEKKEKNIILILLKNGSNPNIKNNLGQTSTQLAIINKLDENIMKYFKEKKGDIYNIKDNYNKTGFDYIKETGDINYENNLIKIFGIKNWKNKLGKKYVQTWNETKLSDILQEIKNNSQSYNYKRMNDKYYFDALLNNNSERNQNKYNQKNNINEFPITKNDYRLNSDTIKNEKIKFEDLTTSNNEKQKEKEQNKIFTHGKGIICSDLNSNNIQIKELNNSSESENESNKSKKSLSDFLAEEVNNLDINNYKGNMDIVDIKNKNINMSRIYSQKSENSNLSKITENNENSNINSNIPFSHSSSRINTYRSDRSNNKQNLYQSNSLDKNKSIIKNIINDTVKKIEVKSISSSEGDNLSKLNILLKDSEKNFNKNNENETNTDNCNYYENGTTSFVMYKNKNSNELNNILTNKENKSINISNINEEINIITQTNKTDKTNKTNEYMQDNTINRNKTIILPKFNYQNQTNNDKNINESSNMKNNEIKDNIFLNSENSHIFSELNTNTNNYNNVSLSYSKNLKSDSKNISTENKNELSAKNINNSNNSLYGNNSNNTRKKRISNGNPSNNNSTGIKKSKSFIDSTSKKSINNKSIYNKFELENFNIKNNENIDSSIKMNNIENNSNKDKIYKKHHRQLSYHINYKSGLNNNKDKEFKRNNTKDIIINNNILQKSNKNEINDIIYQNKNNIAYYTNTKKNNSENKNKNRVSKEPSILINKSIKSLASTNNQNKTITHNIFSNSLTNSNNNNDSNIGFNKKAKKNNSNKISMGNTSNNTAFSTINKNNRQSKFNSNNNIPKKNNNIKISNYNDDIIYNDYDEEDDGDNHKYDIKNINTDILLRLREFLLSCDLLCYYNLMLEKNVYNIDSYINDIQEGISSLTYEDLEKIGIKKPGHIFRILIKLEIESGIIDNNLFNFIIEKINYRSYTTTTLALTSSMNDINCCGINICSNDCKYGKKKSGRNLNFNFSDLSSFLRVFNLTKFKGNFIYNGFDKIEFILIQMFSKYAFDQKILNNYLHIYINKDKIRLLNKFNMIKSYISKEFGIEDDYKEYNKEKGKINDIIKISDNSNENKNKKSIRKNKSYIKEINNSFFNSSKSNDENYDTSNQQDENKNLCYIF